MEASRVFLTSVDWTSFVAVSISSLAIINGLYLLRQYLTDRPKLVIQPVHSKSHLWWARISDGMCEKGVTRNYAFIAYIGVANIGNKPVGVIQTRLKIRLRNFRCYKSPLYNINNPVIELANGQTKILPVFQQRTELFDNVDAIKPGVSDSGITCFHFGFFGSDRWNPKIKNKKIKAQISMKDVYGKTYKANLVFSECRTEALKKLFPGLDDIGNSSDGVFESMLK